VTSSFSQPISTAEVLRDSHVAGALPAAGMASSPTDVDDDADVPLWIVFPLCAAVVAVLAFVVVVILVR